VLLWKAWSLLERSGNKSNDLPITALEIFPLIGRSRDELKKGLRSFVVRKYVVFYTIWQEIPVIIRVVHGSRDLEALFAD
jgi:toxin ParE1/3/4